MEEMWVQCADGRVASGVNAWGALMRSVWWMWPLGVLIGLPGINVGMNAGGGALGRLQRVSGIGSAAALALTGGVVTAERAFMLGLVSNVTAMQDFLPSVQQLAAHLTTLSPVAMAETKKLLRVAAEQGMGAAAEQSPKSLARCFGEGDAGARLQAMIGGRDPEATVH